MPFSSGRSTMSHPRNTTTSPVCISCQTRSARPSPLTSSTVARRYCSGTALGTGACLTIAPSISQNATSPVCMCRQIRSRSEEHTSELQSRENLVCRHLLERQTLLAEDLRVPEDLAARPKLAPEIALAEYGLPPEELAGRNGANQLDRLDTHCHPPTLLG